MAEKNRSIRALIIIFSIICIFIILGNSIDLIEFYNWHGIHNIDFKLVIYIVLGVVAFLSALTLLIVNLINFKKNLSRINVFATTLVIIFCFWIEIQPLNYNKYRQVFKPIGFSRLDKLSKLKYGAYEFDVIYVYRSDCTACLKNKPKLKKFFLENEYDIYDFNLTKTKKKLRPKQYKQFVKRLGITKVPSVIVFSSPDKYTHHNYRRTFTEITRKKEFKKMSDFLLH